MAAGTIFGAHGRDITAAEASATAAAASAASGPITFRDVLDALNPLQFLPVVGTIYRVATGDDGSPTLRTAASLIGGALMGGPVGLLTSMAGVLAEHVFHFEHLARGLLAPPAPEIVAPARPPDATSSPAPSSPRAPAPAASAPPVPHLAAQAAAAYTRTADLPARPLGRVIPGGREG